MGRVEDIVIATTTATCRWCHLVGPHETVIVMHCIAFVERVVCVHCRTNNKGTGLQSEKATAYPDGKTFDDMLSERLRPKYSKPKPNQAKPARTPRTA